MNDLSESYIQSVILDFLYKDTCGSWVKAHSTSKSGTADILGCFHGRFIAIEVKEGGKPAVPDPLQVIYLNSVVDAGGQAICTNDIQDVYDVLNYPSKGRLRFVSANKNFKGLL